MGGGGDIIRDYCCWKWAAPSAAQSGRVMAGSWAQKSATRTGRELGAGAGTSVGLAVGLLVGTAVSSHLALYFENLEDLEENFVQWASAAVSKNLPLWKGSNEMCEKGEGASTLLMDQLQKRGGEFPTNQE